MLFVNLGSLYLNRFWLKIWISIKNMQKLRKSERGNILFHCTVEPSVERVLHGTQNASTWNQKGFTWNQKSLFKGFYYGDSRITISGSTVDSTFFPRVYSSAVFCECYNKYEVYLFYIYSTSRLLCVTCVSDFPWNQIPGKGGTWISGLLCGL